MNRNFSFAIVSAALLTSCVRSEVQLINATDSRISNVMIRVAGNELKVDEIAPGESRELTYRAESEETLSMDFYLRGARRQCENRGYISPPFEDRFEIRISNSGQCSITKVDLQ